MNHLSAISVVWVVGDNLNVNTNLLCMVRSSRSESSEDRLTPVVALACVSPLASYASRRSLIACAHWSHAGGKGTAVGRMVDASSSQVSV
jgi:hypothetical protein